MGGVASSTSTARGGSHARQVERSCLFLQYGQRLLRFGQTAPCWSLPPSLGPTRADGQHCGGRVVPDPADRAGLNDMYADSRRTLTIASLVALRGVWLA